MLGKLFGKKKDKYYLELSEEEINAVPEPAAAPEAPQVEAAAAVASETAPPVDGKAAAPAKKVSAAPAVPTVTAAVSKAAAAMPQEVATPAPMSDPLDLIRTAIAASSAKTAEAETSEATFDYRMPVAKASRRRPGPSMSPFKGMAKDMKRTTAGF